MTLPAAPLCIIQARYNSTRLPGKMLLPLGGETLIERGHRIACEAFGRENVVVAIPATDAAGPLGDELRRIGARIYACEWTDDSDVLTRFWFCVNEYRWNADSVIVRWTPDDWRKSPEMCRRVAAGERMPVQIGAEAFTFAMLAAAQLKSCRHARNGDEPDSIRRMREHITHAIFTVGPPEPVDDGLPWSIDTQEDYERACEWVAKHEGRRVDEIDVAAAIALSQSRVADSATRAAYDQPGNEQK